MNGELRQDVLGGLASVLDPCSVATRTNLSVVEMGMVTDVAVNADGRVTISLCPTAPSCILIASIMKDVERTIAALPGVSSVEVQLDPDTFWTPELMSRHGKRKLDAARARVERRRDLPVKWTERQARQAEHAAG